MKKFGLILAGCLAFVGFYNAHADDIGDAVRAAVRRDTNTTTVTTRQRSDSATNSTTTRNSATKTSAVVNRTATNTRNNNVVNRAAEPIIGTPTNVVARTTTAPRTTGNATSSVKTRSTTQPIQVRSTTRKTPTRTNVSRAATTIATREDILNRSYSKCKEVLTECMDEFCANKDSQLKRCACSARIHDFDKIKKQLANVDEKMLDFNQRLLTVSMDEKDVAAINIATEGEKAFYDTVDASESKRTLDAIAKKLNTNFDKSNFSSSLGTVLSWSLDMDSAFDTVDSLAGVSTAAKSGTALYSAALPVCREMAAEVCSDDDLALAESGYQILIDRDCDTVEKTYKTAAEQARNKVLESSALLDISRLNVYQKNNADDILTCKKKMLTMLTDSTVCGSDLGKCLDITGQYIDPSTGEAFLSAELSNLSDLISRPEENQTWARAPGNAVFVSFLNSKKKFLESAMDNCQDIADTVWNAFIEDALSQIKIAQLRKLEEVRQSCTTLVGQCLTNAAETLEAFDARALSTFGVAADTTAKAMCSNVLSSCTTLLEITDDKQEWYAGMTGIQTDITFDTIKHTCREVGRACVIQVCTSTSGNFGLCEDIDLSVNRKSIINHTACWNEVLNCVGSAGEDTINAIFAQNGFYNTVTDPDTQITTIVPDEYALYKKTYGDDYLTPTITISDDPVEQSQRTSQCVSPGSAETATQYCVYDICYEECEHYAYTDTNTCRVCRLAESIWGNCEAEPITRLEEENMHNRIKKPADYENNNTILYWFAQNTNTQDRSDSCRDTTCPVGYFPSLDETTNTIMCLDSNKVKIDSLNRMCDASVYQRVATQPIITNCCQSKVLDYGKGCCASKTTTGQNPELPTRCMPVNGATMVATFTIPDTSSDTYYSVDTLYALYCYGNFNTETLYCDGRFFIVDASPSARVGIHYMDPHYNDTTQPSQYVCEYFEENQTTKYIRKYETVGWGWYNGDTLFNDGNDQYGPNAWTVSFGGCGN
ncbi:MAG: hypothetical protein J6Y49_02960 [Alphaproteobacteria bacterium]|nr:hypothetical protein [Alphaproteobacteria bacterium]